jgi:chaperonin GroES
LKSEKAKNKFCSRTLNEVRTRPDWSSGPGWVFQRHHFCSTEENMSFRPLHDRILVRRVESQEKTKGGIIIPDTAKEKPSEGEVVAVGTGARNEAGQIQALDVHAGDRILFGKWSGTEIKINGEDLLIMKESDVLGIIEAQAEQKKAA